MKEFFCENHNIEVIQEYDVIIVGGGIAGSAAALAAGRYGAKTLLIEKSTVLGGLATLGNIVIYLPLCDGMGHKIIGGISEELLHLSIKYGYSNLPEIWLKMENNRKTKERYQTVFNSPAFIVALDEVIKAANVDLLLDTLFSVPVMHDNFCKGIIVENKSGRIGYKGKVIVDATGDADVMFRAGAKCFEQNNWLSYWCSYTNLEVMKDAVNSNDIMKAINIMSLGGECNGKGAPVDSKKYQGTNAKEITEFILQGRELLRAQLIRKDRNNHCAVSLPGMPQFRTTRRICGKYELTNQDAFQHFDDSIGCTGDWRKAGPIYEVPFRSLIVKNISNIISAGRIISSCGDAWEVTRVIPTAALTGQAAGTAAAIAAHEGCSIDKVNIKELQDVLSQNGVLIHY